LFIVHYQLFIVPYPLSIVHYQSPSWRSRRFLIELLLSTIAVAGALGLFTRYLQFNERRGGAVLHDPLLILLEPRDLSWVIFGLVYLTTLLAAASLLRHPFMLLVAIRSYTLMLLVRIAALYMAPFDPPAGLVTLSDPLAAIVGVGPDITRDLFFSGHTATIFIFFLTAVDPPLRWLFLLSSIAVGICVMMQHVHYSLDVLAAPFFAYGCYRAALLLTRRYSPASEGGEQESRV
jgi:hypothetical protein